MFFLKLLYLIILAISCICIDCFLKTYANPTIKLNNKVITNCNNVSQAYKCAKYSYKVKTARYYYVADKYKLHICAINKNFSSMLSAIACYLFDETSFFKKHKHLFEDYYESQACKATNFANRFGAIATKYNGDKFEDFLESWKHIIVVRPPVERFLSAYAHICTSNDSTALHQKTCFHCKQDIKCFVTKLYKEILDTASGTKNANIHRRNHFYPVSWACEYLIYKDFYTVLKYSSANVEVFYDSLLKVLKHQNVSTPQLTYIAKELGHRNYHSTFGSKNLLQQKEKLLSSPVLLDYISRIYYDDFKNFDFPLPNLYNQFSKKESLKKKYGKPKLNKKKNKNKKKN
uniref:Sulfotransfer_1 domain-containing protein n=1 Tax=Rhabditophanes sp. KR3021 TaxID=114890 RepID=A0AC35TUU1_9BILA